LPKRRKVKKTIWSKATLLKIMSVSHLAIAEVNNIFRKMKVVTIQPRINSCLQILMKQTNPNPSPFLERVSIVKNPWLWEIKKFRVSMDLLTRRWNPNSLPSKSCREKGEAKNQFQAINRILNLPIKLSKPGKANYQQPCQKLILT